MKPLCPSPVDWQGLLNGELSEPRIRELEDHLETCGDCRDRLDQLAGQGTVRFSFATDLEDPGADADSSPSLEDAMAGLKGIAPTHREDLLPFLESPTSPNHLGRFGSYDIESVIAEGGMGVVLKARDPVLDRWVAIKVLAPSLAAGERARARFVREARAAAAIRHDHVLPVHAVGTEAGLPYLVLPYIAGPTLEQWIATHGALPESDVIRIGRQLACALEAAHARGLVHRDVKPGNVLMEDGPTRVWLADFGLARAVEAPELTQAGVVAGTPRYMSPEQAEGRPVDMSSDLFSLGAVLYAMATGAAPFQADSAVALLRQVVEHHPPAPRDVNPAISESLSGVIERLMAKQPSDRYPSASAVVAVLDALVEESSPAVSVPGGPSSARTAWIAVGILAVLAAVLIGPWLRRPPQTAADPPLSHPVSGPPFRIAESDQEFHVFADAVAAARSGDTILLSTNDPIDVQPIRLIGTALTLRAAPGFIPVLVGRNTRKPMFLSDASLVLDGLVLEHKVVAVNSPPMIRMRGAPLVMDRCRVRKAAEVSRTMRHYVSLVVAEDAPRITVRSTEIYATEPFVQLFTLSWTDTYPADASSLRFEQSLFLGAMFAEVDHRTSAPLSVELKQCMLIHRYLFRLLPLDIPYRLDVSAHQNLLMVGSLVMGDIPRAEATAEWFQWEGRQNLMMGVQYYLGHPLAQRGPNTPIDTLAAWRQFPGVTEQASVVDSSTFVRRDLFPLGDEKVSERIPEVFTHARTILPAVGPDLDKLGPGAADPSGIEDR